MMDDQNEIHSEWNAILGKLAQKLFQDYFNEPRTSSFSFEYSKSLSQFKEDANLSIAEHLHALKIQVLNSYNGAFTREIEGRLIKESLYFQKKFDEAYRYLCQAIKQEFTSQMKDYENSIDASIKEQIEVLKSQTTAKIEKVIHSEKMHLERKNAEYLQQAQKNLDFERLELDRMFAEQLQIARGEVEREFKESRSLERQKLEDSHAVDIQNYKANLALRHAEEVEKYRNELKLQLNSEVRTWLSHQIEQLKLESNAHLATAISSEQSEYLLNLESKKRELIGKLDHWGRTIKSQTKTKKAKEQVLFMEQQAAQMLRELASAVHQIRLQSNIHIDSLRSDFR
jgi:hypothetical protein